MSKKSLIGIIVLVIIAVSAALFVLLSSAPEEAPAPILDRNKDPGYIKTLQGQRVEQQKVGGELAKAQQELAAAKEAAADEETVKALEKKVEGAKLEVEKNRQVSMAIIRQRMLQEQAEKEKARQAK